MTAEPRTILFVTTELAPYAKIGGLGDVLASLPDTLAQMGADVHVLMPLYQGFPVAAMGPVAEAGTATVPVGALSYTGSFQRVARPSGVTLWLLDVPSLYNRAHIYGEHNDIYPDSATRFVTLSKMAVALAERIQPDIIHVNDWFTALVPIFLKEQQQRRGLLTATRTVLTIHNLAFQGLFDFYDWHLLGLPYELFNFRQLEYFGKINFLKGGIVWADAVTTVSPSYAEEILTKNAGKGLDGVLREHKGKLRGILNGIDTSVWNPETDSFLPAHYSATNLAGKYICRQELIQQAGLTVSDSTAIIGVISRLSEQKGFYELKEAFPELMSMDVAFVILGSGDPELEESIEDWRQRWPGRVGVFFGYNEPAAHLIEAGGDFFLMPSRFEPCGMNQMFSQRYGSLPIVHGVGGLKDTVTDLREHPDTGVGFVLRDLSPSSFVNTLAQALHLRADEPALFEAARRRAMARDFGWEPSARSYCDLYEEVLGAQ